MWVQLVVVEVVAQQWSSGPRRETLLGQPAQLPQGVNWGLRRAHACTHKHTHTRAHKLPAHVLLLPLHQEDDVAGQAGAPRPAVLQQLAQRVHKGQHRACGQHRQEAAPQASDSPPPHPRPGMHALGKVKHSHAQAACASAATCLCLKHQLHTQPPSGPPLLSVVPRPYNQPSSLCISKGSYFQPSSMAGWTS